MKSDAEIRKDVISELGYDAFIKECDIDVKVERGVVSLAGKVNSLAQKIHAEKAARKVAGVKAIAENISVQPEPSARRTDAEIAHSVVNILEWNSAVPQDAISVKVENGVVSLDGHVDWEFQRNAASKAVSGLRGVLMVNNMIRVTPKVSISDVRSEISSALHRSATVNAEHIVVFIDGSRVALQGTVSSHAARKEAEAAAWNAPGVTHVDSFIDVESGAVMV